MSILHRIGQASVFLFACIAQTAYAVDCDGRLFSNSFEDAFVAQFEVAVEVSALGDNQPGRSVSLQLHGGETLQIITDGTFCFVQKTSVGDNYSVVVTSQPAQGENCTLSNASGTTGGPVSVALQCGAAESLWDQMLWDEDDWQ